MYSNLYTYKASECKRAIIRLHCATSKSSLWNMEYVAHGSAFERPCIYRTSIHIHVYKHMYMYMYMYIYTVSSFQIHYIH